MLTLFVGRSPEHQDTRTESDSEMRNIHERLFLQNLWADADVDFEAVIFGLPGSLSVVLKPMEGTVPAGGRLELQVSSLYGNAGLTKRWFVSTCRSVWPRLS